MKKIRREFIFLCILAFVFTLVGCNNDKIHNNNEAESIVNNVINQVKIPNQITKPLELKTKIDQVSIEWESEEPLYINPNDGSITIGIEDVSFNLFATFTYGNIIKRIKYSVTVPVIDVNALDYAWNFYNKKIPSQTIQNLSLITKDYANCSVKYVSDNPEIITDDGKINQSNIDQNVNFYTFITSGNISKIYLTNITVSKLTEIQILNKVTNEIKEAVEQLKQGEIDALPYINDEYGAIIKWHANDLGLITYNGYIIKPLIPRTIKFSCTLSLGTYSNILSFTIENFGGNMTKDDQLKHWLKAQLPTYILGVKNYVHDEYGTGELYLDYQERTNSNAVLNLIDGSPINIDQSYFIDINNNSKPFINRFFGSGSLSTNTHPAVPQSTLDSLFYEGYQMPNEQNVLWIVVHESGMPLNGQDAELLAKLQWNNAYSNPNARQASWNYQVDAYKIYQSFDDEVICWHAGDGTVTRGSGNNNGIGIEMCINQDGNYDGALHNNAKLVAYLMHKYNLSLDNVKRHADFANKECPSYMIRTKRWEEFLEIVNREYMAIEFLANATVTWEVTTDTNDNTESVLNTYFYQGDHNLWFSKPVSTPVNINLKMTVLINGEVIVNTSTITLKPNIKKSDE